jgi:hypothetical protein
MYVFDAALLLPENISLLCRLKINHVTEIRNMHSFLGPIVVLLRRVDYSVSSECRMLSSECRMYRVNAVCYRVNAVCIE